MNKVICTTTIYPPTEALIKFAAMEDWQLVVAGDKKTPSYDKFLWDNPCHVHYLSPDVQEQYDPKLSELIGWNCIQRRNFAFLFACKELKADLVCSVDDDNIPMDGWGENVNVGNQTECVEYITEPPAFDPLSVTNHYNLWHRGFPMELILGRKPYPAVRTKAKCDIQADLWNGDPDVDAICRLTCHTSNLTFPHIYLPFTSNKPSPFNSQNTFLSREVMPHYFMFPGIGRLDDIAASYHVQAQGFRVMYGGPTVVQKRNEHNVVTDLLNEIWGIKNNLAIVKEVPTNKNAVIDRLPQNAVEAFRQYQTHFE